MSESDPSKFWTTKRVSRVTYHRSKIFSSFCQKNIYETYLATDHRDTASTTESFFNGAHMLYVDRKTVDDPHSSYPELKDWSLVSSQPKDY